MGRRMERQSCWQVGRRIDWTGFLAVWVGFFFLKKKKIDDAVFCAGHLSGEAILFGGIAGVGLPIAWTR